MIHTPTRLSVEHRDWLGAALTALRTDGYVIVEDVLTPDFLAQTRERMYRVREKIVAEIGNERLLAAGERGVLRLMMKFDPFFLRYLELPTVLTLVDATVSNTALLHLQNGFILRPATEAVFQNRFHRDFPRWMNGYCASINLLFAVDPFQSDNGATRVVPGSHLRGEIAPEATLEANAVSAECPEGSMVVFDSMLVHAAGNNTSQRDRLAINHQFTRSFFKQQIDYVRALGESAVIAQPERVQQLLGYCTRVPTSLDEFYQPEARRLYRRHQG